MDTQQQQQPSMMCKKKMSEMKKKKDTYEQYGCYTWATFDTNRFDVSQAIANSNVFQKKTWCLDENKCRLIRFNQCNTNTLNMDNVNDDDDDEESTCKKYKTCFSKPIVYFNTPISMADYDIFKSMNFPVSMIHFVYIDPNVPTTRINELTIDRIMTNIRTLSNVVLITSNKMFNMKQTYKMNLGNCDADAIAEVLSGVMLLQMYTGRRVTQEEFIDMMDKCMDVTANQEYYKQIAEAEPNKPLYYNVYDIFDMKREIQTDNSAECEIVEV
jgi:hypothetical protein